MSDPTPSTDVRKLRWIGDGRILVIRQVPVGEPVTFELEGREPGTYQVLELIDGDWQQIWPEEAGDPVPG